MIGDDTIADYSEAGTNPNKLETEVLRRVAQVGISQVAQAIKRDVSRVSMITGDKTGIKLKFLAPFLDSLGLKVVDKQAVTVDREEYVSCKTLARKYLEITTRGGDE